MLKELFESVVLKVEDGCKPFVKRLDGTNKLIVAHDGEIETHEVKETPPNLFSATVSTLADLVASAKFLQTQAQQRRKTFLIESVGKSSIWCSRDSVVAVCDNEIMADTVECKLTPSTQFQAIASLDKAFNQIDLIKFLRITLDGTGAESYVKCFRDLKFDRSVSSGGKSNHVDESLGRSIETAVVSGQEIPETLKINVPVYANRDIVFAVPITIFVTLNFEHATVQLTNAPNQSFNALQDAASFVVSRVKELVGDADDVLVATGNVVLVRPVKPVGQVG